MELLFKDIKNLLSKNISVSQMGLIFTLILSKDLNPKLTLAKFKTFVKTSDYKTDLIELHEKGYINWSGYKNAKKSLEEKKQDPNIKEVIDLYNKLSKRKISHKTESNISALRSRLKEHTLQECLLVVSNRHESWVDEPIMYKHFIPSTIFRKANFQKYLDDAIYTNVGKSLVNAKDLGLKKGDEISAGNSQNFEKESVYEIKIYNTDSNGQKRGIGKNAKRKGFDINKMCKSNEYFEKVNGIKEFIYIYNGN